MNIGTVAAGRIGLAVLRRLHPFDVKLHYTDRHRLPLSVCLLLFSFFSLYSNWVGRKRIEPYVS